MGLLKKGPRLNAALNGGVDGGNGTEFHRDRIKELLSALLGTRATDLDQNIVASDNPRTTGKRGGRQVSFETLDGNTRSQQEALDDLVVRENLSHGAEAPKVDGLAPCQRVNQGETNGGRRRGGERE